MKIIRFWEIEKKGFENMAILIVSEKPAVAKALLPVVGANNRKNGYFEGGVTLCHGVSDIWYT